MMELKEELQKYSKVLNESSETQGKMYPVLANGKELGSIWQERNGWAAESNKTGNTWDMIDTLEIAVNMICEEYNLSPRRIIISVK